MQFVHHRKHLVHDFSFLLPNVIGSAQKKKGVKPFET